MTFHAAVQLGAHGIIGYDPAAGIYRASGSILCFGALSCSANHYIPFGASFANAASTATIGLASIWLPRPGKLLNLMVIGGGGAGTVTLRLNDVDTALARASSGGYTPFYNNADVVAVAAGQRLSARLTGSPSGEWFVAVEYA